MPNLAHSLIAVPKIDYKFLEDLLKILGQPDEIIFRVWNRKYRISNITIKEGYAEQSCIADNPTILKVYLDNAEKCSLSQLSWYGSKKDKTFQLILSAKFTPYKFDLSINRRQLPRKYDGLVELINKYKVSNNITLLHARD